MKNTSPVLLALLLAGCSAGVPATFSKMDFGIGSTLMFSGPERSLVLEEDAEPHEYGKDYRITLIVDGGTAAHVAMSVDGLTSSWSFTPQYWDRKNRAVVDLDGKPYPLVDVWQELSSRDHRFVMVSMHGQRYGDGAALSALGCPEQEFYLRTRTGLIKGPFIRPKEGAPLQLGADYTVIRPHRRQLEYQRILENVVVPDVDFRRATAGNAIAFLDAEFKRLAPGEYMPIGTRPGESYALPTVSWAATGVSLLDALEITCALGRLQFYVEDERIVVAR